MSRAKNTLATKVIARVSEYTLQCPKCHEVHSINGIREEIGPEDKFIRCRCGKTIEAVSELES